MRKIRENNTVVPLFLRIKAFGIALCIVWLISSPGYALWVGQSQINPFLEIQGEYQSNIYRVDSEEDSDFVTVISPGIHFEYPTTKNPTLQAVIDYRADMKLFGNDGDSTIDPDSQLNTVAHRFGGYMQYNLTSGWRLKGGYTFNATSTPPDFRRDTRNEYKQHDFLGLIGYTFANRYKIEIEYDGRFRGYDDSEFQADDLNINDVKLVGFYRIQPRMSLLLGGDYAMFDRKAPFYDNTEYRVYSGVEYEATENTKGLVKIGMASKQFDTEAVDDATDFYVNGEVKSDYAENSSWSLRVFRDHNDSAVSDATAVNGTYYTSTGFGGKIAHTFASLPNVSLLVSLLLSQDYYPDDTDKRKDNKVNGELGLEYKFYKFVSIGAGYRYDSRNSNIDVRNYTDHIAFMKIRGLM